MANVILFDAKSYFDSYLSTSIMTEVDIVFVICIL